MRRPTITADGEGAAPATGESRQAFGLQINGIAPPRSPRMTAAPDVDLLYKIVVGPLIVSSGYNNTWLILCSSAILSASYFPWWSPRTPVALSPSVFSHGGDTAEFPGNPVGTILGVNDPLVVKYAQPFLVQATRTVDHSIDPSGQQTLQVFLQSYMGPLNSSGHPTDPMLGEIVAAPLNWSNTQ